MGARLELWLPRDGDRAKSTTMGSASPRRLKATHARRCEQQFCRLGRYVATIHADRGGSVSFAFAKFLGVPRLDDVDRAEIDQSPDAHDQSDGLRRPIFDAACQRFADAARQLIELRHSRGNGVEARGPVTDGRSRETYLDRIYRVAGETIVPDHDAYLGTNLGRVSSLISM